MKALYILVIALILCGQFVSKATIAQDVYHHPSNENIYELLDELATIQVIDLNTAVKPYSRRLIAQKLSEAAKQPELLTARQQKEVSFFLKDFNKELRPNRDFNKRLDLFYYKDSMFTISVNPILGANLLANSNDEAFQRTFGAEAFGYYGKNIGFYINLQESNENIQLSGDSVLTQRPGARYQSDNDYSDVRVGITYRWKWGTFGALKDQFVWGNNYNGSNIFSGRAPAIPQIRLNLRPTAWLEFTYLHAWLESGVVDSTRSLLPGATYELVIRPKYMATNFLTVRPFPKLGISVGNSIMYSDQDPSPNFLNPLLFYKSADHTLINVGSTFLGQNSQMFFDISSRQIRGVHLFTSLFIDEISISRMFEPDQQTNFYSWKIGGRLTPAKLQNFSLIAEFTRSNPLTYRHFVNTTTFDSDGFRLGHYLGDNTQDIYLAMRFKPLARWRIDLSFSDARVGERLPYTGVGTASFGLNYLEQTKWHSREFKIHTRYELMNDVVVSFSVGQRNVSGPDRALYTPEFLLGNNLNVSAGLNWGF